ncbi:MAG: lipid-transfer protein, partial [Hyphomicrobiales bacterium]|nr:lipid-transfer protein [Hyphomicrobiales bacterium]
CFFAYEEELFSVAAGLGEDVDISPSGGLLAGCVPVVAGLSRMAEAALRLSEMEGTRHRALTHGTWGPAAQGQVVALLEGAAL